MSKFRLHTPDGVRDIIGDECRKKLSIENTVSSIIDSYGYDPIQTPSFEFFDLFGSSIGTVSSKELYKFFDREGETIVLRPDFTPSVARCAGKYFNNSNCPIRLYYNGRVFSNHKRLRGNLNERSQIGGECIGDPSIEADAEMIAMLVRTLESCGLSEFGISIGHAAVFDSLVDALALNEDDIDEIHSLAANKNFFALDEFLEKRNANPDIRGIFQKLSSMYKSPEEFKELTDAFKVPNGLSDALLRLSKLSNLLDIYEASDHVSYDLGFVSEYRYYTGIVFSGFTYGSGQPIVSGGRYDRLLNKFGKDSPAIGFAIDIDQLLISLDRQSISTEAKTVKKLIVYLEDHSKKAIEKADELRSLGEKVMLYKIKDRSEYEALMNGSEGTDLIYIGD
ncbi:MAG: ATP phosphoribosyltransferase regulatory subunit [Lachnospiraceae bacterium]|nr:ATP phosphoribosyltransferase regulatory subunit [Lachnospiraceae bacterium]